MLDTSTRCHVTARASIGYMTVYQLLAEMSGGAENLVFIMYGDETTFRLQAVLAVARAQQGIPLRFQGNSWKSGPSTFVFINEAGSVFYNAGSIGTTTADHVEDQLLGLLGEFDDCRGPSSGVLLVIDNATWRGKALSKTFEGSAYFLPSSNNDADLWGRNVDAEPLDASSCSGASSHAKAYVIRDATASGTKNKRIFPNTSSGMAAFQPCKILFSSLKSRMEQQPSDVSSESSVQKEHALAIENLLRSAPGDVVKGCVQLTEHFPRAWFVRSQVAPEGRPALCLTNVKNMVANVLTEFCRHY